MLQSPTHREKQYLCTPQMKAITSVVVFLCKYHTEVFDWLYEQLGHISFIVIHSVRSKRRLWSNTWDDLSCTSKENLFW